MMMMVVPQAHVHWHQSACSCLWDQCQRHVSGNIDFCLDSIEIGEAILNNDRLKNVKKRNSNNEIGHTLCMSSNDFLFYYD